MEGLQILKRVADEYDLAVISEIVNPQHIEEAIDYIDVIQIGARNMQNFEALKSGRFSEEAGSAEARTCRNAEGIHQCSGVHHVAGQ